MGIFDGTDQKQMAAMQKSFVNPVNPAKLAAQMSAKQVQMQAHNQATLTGVVQNAKERFDPNKSEAYQIPLSQLVAMWQVKYGDAWVDAEKPYDPKDFYHHAFNRLNDNRLFERVDGWVRLKENVEKLLANC